MRCCR